MGSVTDFVCISCKKKMPCDDADDFDAVVRHWAKKHPDDVARAELPQRIEEDEDVLSYLSRRRW